MPERLLASEPAAAGRSIPAGASGARVPPGYEILALPLGAPREGAPVSSARGTLILKSALRDSLLAAGIAEPESMAAGPHVVGWLEGGRARHALIRWQEEEWVLKSYRRGGIVGRWNSQRYWGSERFLKELHVAARAQEAGVPTAEVLALVLEAAGLRSTRAWLLTRFLAGAKPLADCGGLPDELQIFRAAGETVRRMHLAGIDHHDLHLGNIVITREPRGPRVHIMDWDLARVRSEGSWSPFANLVRLWRSLEKGGKLGEIRLRPWSVPAFARGYFAGRPAALRKARAYFRRRALLLRVRSWFWRSSR